MTKLLFKSTALLTLLTLVSTTIFTPLAFAQRTETVKPLNVTKLDKYRGQFLTVLYVVGNKPMLSVDDRQIGVVEIKNIVDARSITGGSMELPIVQLPQIGFRPTYNFVIFIVHSQRQFFWSNADGSIPADPRGTTGIHPSNHASLLVKSLSKQELDKLNSEQGNPAQITVTLQ